MKLTLVGEGVSMAYYQNQVNTVFSDGILRMYILQVVWKVPHPQPSLKTLTNFMFIKTKNCPGEEKF